MAKDLIKTTLENLKETRENVNVFLSNGIKIQGSVVDFDGNIIAIQKIETYDNFKNNKSNYNRTNFVFLSQISTIQFGE